jgi:gliding motility-associated-like protein
VNNLPAGTYTLSVTDNCSTLTNTVTIAEPAALALAASSKTDATCNGTATGTVTAGAVTNAVGTVTYTWKNASATVVGTSATVSNLPAGTYTLSVTDNCSTLTNSVTIAQPAALALAASSKTDATCNGTATGSLTAGAVTNAIGTVNYSWKNASGDLVGTTTTVSNLPAGNYTLAVSDNCSTLTNSVTIGEPGVLTLTTSSKADATCNGTASGTVTAGAVTNAVGALNYTWKNASATVVGTTAVVNNLPAGVYTLSVTDNCNTLTNTVTIAEPPALTLAASSKTDATCNGTSTGTVTAGAVSNSIGTVSYSWKNASGTVVGTTAVISSLPAGTYTLTVTDNCSTQTNSVTIDQPAALTLTASFKTDATCNGTATGTVSAGTVNNAVGAVNYTWRNTSGTVVGNTANVGNLTFGTYTLSVTDNCNTLTNTVSIAEPPALTLAASSKTDATCNGSSTGSLTAGAVANAVGTINYSWANASGTVIGTTASVSNVPAGTYMLSVTDNCNTLTNTVTIAEPAALALAASSKTDATCHGTSTGSVTAGTVTNAVGTVNYNWKNASGTVVGTTATVGNLPSGTYAVTVTDNCSTLTNSVTIAEPAVLALAPSSKTDASCNGTSTGSVASGTVTNAVGTVNYSWKNASGTVVGTTATVSNLPAGTYTLSVTDNCNTLTNSVTIAEPSALALAASSKTDATCNGTATGTVTAGTASNAIGTVNYSWANASGTVVGTTATVNNLPAGTYTLSVTDNCSTLTNSITIAEPAALALAASSKTDATCNATSTGTLTAGTVSNAIGTVNYSWTNASATVVGTTATVSNLPAGTYTLSVTDNCSTLSNSVTIAEPAALALAASSKTDATCNGTATGTLTAGAVTNALGTVNYSWKNASGTVVGTTATVNNLPAGTYTLSVTDNCSTLTNSVTIAEPAAMTLAVSSKTDATCNGTSTGTVTAGTIANAIGTVNYTWTNASGDIVGTTTTVNNLPAGVYTLSATDNCSTLTNSVIIAEPAALTLAASSKTDATCNGTATGTVTAGAVSNAIGTVNYSWANASGTVVGTTATVSNLAAGTYTLSVTDNCSTKTTSVTILTSNCGPLAIYDSFSGSKNVPLPGNVSLNDSDPDGDILTFSVVTPPQYGKLVLEPNGNFTFTPTVNWKGSTTFTYRACDPKGLCATTTVDLLINDLNYPPVAVDDKFNTAFNAPVNATVATNDNEPDGDNVTFTVVSPGSHGQVTMNPDGSFIYTPDKNYSGPDKFTYKICDALGLCANAGVTITVADGLVELKIPNVFTPNGDGVNETFEIRDLNIFLENEITIINRWGNSVYEKKNYENTWDGNGLDEGTYFYVLKVKDKKGDWKTYKGYVMLLRSKTQ